ncbi:DUF305 domain-containing protein [Sphingomicrobium clamense]|uniref:DUF305 domain-containing protein n=1 Tax=Sphingomicrobium clamense TaxID=2851013 RepID=A0ABS6V8E3_9SPHN|nr:DUF305 domain-containing protein [Sphingomicrobium sp. B8]MBW0145610.1 DUF305 domain-containing protein [Sphingomicrobium sp. B8]
MNETHEGHKSQKQMWMKFAGMIATSTIVMFVLMHQLVYEADHLTFSLNRFIASLVSGSTMVIIMLGFMWSMYRDPALKKMVVVGAAIVFVGLLFVNRQQVLIGDEGYMRSMIPHHSIAINNSRKATITDPRVRKLADDIMKAQVKEIAEMKMLLEDIEVNGKQGDGSALPPRTADLTPELLEKAEKPVEPVVEPEVR